MGVLLTVLAAAAMADPEAEASPFYGYGGFGAGYGGLGAGYGYPYGLIQAAPEVEVKEVETVELPAINYGGYGLGFGHGAGYLNGLGYGHGAGYFNGLGYGHGAGYLNGLGYGAGYLNGYGAYGLNGYAGPGYGTAYPHGGYLGLRPVTTVAAAEPAAAEE